MRSCHCVFTDQFIFRTFFIFIFFVLLILNIIYCAFHKHANSIVRKPPSQFAFFAAINLACEQALLFGQAK